MSAWYDGKQISIDKVQQDIEYRRKSIERYGNIILKGEYTDHLIFFTYTLDCDYLCDDLLYLKQYDQIKELRKKCCDIDFKGRSIYGCNSLQAKFLLHRAIRTRDIPYYQQLARDVERWDILIDSKGYKNYDKNCYFSLLYVILDKKEASDFIRDFEVSERLANGKEPGLGIGEAQVMKGIVTKDKDAVIKGAISLLEYRSRTYKRNRELPLDQLGFGSYVLYLAKDKGISINVKEEIPEKFHIIIPDVLNID